MKVLFITPYNCDLIHAVSLPLGILSIATYLNANGNEAKICDLSVSHTDIKKLCAEFSPDIIGISILSVKHLDGAMFVTKKLKGFGVPIVWGGPFCDVSDPEILLRDGKADYISFSEGEETWLEITQRLAKGTGLEDCKGLAYLKDGKAVRTPEREFIDLASLPELDFSLIDVRKYSQYLYGCKNLMYVYMAKGCPAHCTFCTNALSHRCTYRRRSLEKFMNETRVLVNDYGVDGLYFGDEVFCLTKNELYEFCDAMDNSGLKLSWGFQTRIGILSEKEFKRAYESGCRWVDFGIESGNKEQLLEMKKGIPYELIEPTFDWCNKIGIISLANFIIGLPGETEQQLRDTVELASRIKSTQCTFLKFCISPNTEMGKKAIENGLMKHKIEKIGDYKKIDFFVSRTDNFSHIPVKELDVIQSFYLWNAIFRKDYGKKTHDFDLLLKQVQTLLRRLSFLSLKHATACFIEICCLFARFFFDTHCHPSVIKKYDLKKE